MKKTFWIYIFISCLGLASCKKEEKSSKAIVESPLQVTCYQAVYEKDTVTLKLNTLKDGTITGNMVMKEMNSSIKDGTINGKFSGDTLLVDYTYVSGPNDKTVFKNPLALLKKGNVLVLGNGKIETYFGKTYFIKGQPIDYEKVKYKFSESVCQD